MQILEEYEAKLDAKRRCVIHGIPAFDHFHVKAFASGRIEMTPGVLAKPEELSENTLRTIYSSVNNLKKGNAGKAVDFDKYSDYLKDEE